MLAPTEQTCPGWPTDRRTVRPDAMCRQCERWKQTGGESAPRFVLAPARVDLTTLRLGCEFRKTKG